ncbi:uncharacterized protein LOC131076474 [Cryptomeria japonica]|uniref:uncharacterized protein LOC131076474 n=1 Tax=Cryptomeria japonica TaxID=3369 RepID=UPI0025AD889D|nr:uncharacterized protein LOC131076474 [Cryptomeria japonica]
MADGKGKVKVKTKMMNTKVEALLIPADSDLLKPLKVKKEAQSPKEIKDISKSGSVNTKVKKEAQSPKEIKDNSKSGSVNTKVKKEAQSPKEIKDKSKSGSVNSKVKKEAQSPEKGHTSDDKSEKKQRKLYDLPGQKRDPPPERDPLRIFYETLYEQIPTSEMAEFWMMEHGLLTPEKAKKTFEKKQKKHLQLKPGSPVKPSSSKKNIQKSSAKDVGKDSSKPKKKRAHLSDSDSDELILPKKKIRMSS